MNYFMLLNMALMKIGCYGNFEKSNSPENKRL